MSASEALPEPVGKAQRTLQRGLQGLHLGSTLDQKSMHIFNKFSVLSSARYRGSTPSLRPEPSPAAWVFGYFRPGNAKSRFVLAHVHNVEFDTPYTFFFFGFLYHCHGAFRDAAGEANAIPPTPFQAHCVSCMVASDFFQ